jgi:hypothetical protein
VTSRLRVLALGAACASGLAASAALAHPLAPALLEIVETSGGTAQARFRTSAAGPGSGTLHPRLPDRCRLEGTPQRAADATAVTWTARFDCGGAGLGGERVSVYGLERGRSPVLVRIERPDGRVERALLHAGATSLVVGASADPLARSFALGREGAAHFAGGIDHVLFVLGLVLLGLSPRRLAVALTGFTAGHATTLALAAAGWLRVAPALAELGIAASLLLLAAAVARRELGGGRGGGAGWLARRPGPVALCLGLLHGLGFARALSDLGVARAELPLAIGSFHLGIECAQLALVATWLATRNALAGARSPEAGAGRRRLSLATQAIGSVSAWLCLDRAAVLILGA